MPNQSLSSHIQPWITIERLSYWPRRLVWHGAWALSLTAFLVLIGLVTPAALPLPGCRFLEAVKLPCPTCGFTRAFHMLANGEWRDAWRAAPLSLPLFFSIVIALGWHIMPLLTGYRIRLGDKLRFSRRGRLVLIIAVMGLFLMNWVYRLLSGNV